MRLLARLAALIATLALAASAAAEPAPARIVAVGDLHGDFPAWRAIAQAAGLVDARGRWRGGETVLVQLGDVADRGPGSRRILEDLMRLQQEAPRAGGRVVALVGNHEAMNVTGDLRYVEPGEYLAFADRQSAARRQAAWDRNQDAIVTAYRARDAQLTVNAVKQAWLADTPLGWLEHRDAWRPQGRIGRWVAANPAVVQLGGSLFVHGGLCPPYAGRPLAAINAEVAAALAAASAAPEAVINDEEGPLWCRRLATPEPDAARREALVAGALTPYGARRIVIGHTPAPGGVVITDQGRVVRIDTGISSAYGGKLAWLVIEGDAVGPHETPRPPVKVAAP